jgi:anti-sigma B factor antagonist
MNINTKIVDGVTIIEISGDVEGKSAPEIQKRILPLAQAGRKLILDMGHVNYMSSAGLRALLAAHREATTHAGKLVLVRLPEPIRDTMSVTGFLSFFETFDTPGDGLAALV